MNTTATVPARRSTTAPGRSANRKIIVPLVPFPYGETIQPEWDQIGGYLEESGREQICPTQEELQRLRELSTTFTYAPWKMGKWVHRRPSRYNVDTRVSVTKYGYRALHTSRYGSYMILGHTLAEIPLLFPTAEDAIIATEIALHDLPEGWTLKWFWSTSCGFQRH
jgi:hypothetical protein